MLNVIILGSGCPTCKKLEKMCADTVAENNLEANIEKITDIKKFAEYGIMFTPGLVINGEVKCSGKLPTPTTLANWLIKAAE